MKMLLSKTPGPPESLVLEDAPDPVPGPGQVLIRVAACGVNYPDSLIIEDRYQFRPERPFAPGGEVSGVVEAVGEGVGAPVVGERVIGSAISGGMAEKLLLPAERCVPIPHDMPMHDAAAFLMTYGTSLHALKDRAALKAGETLLVLGAAGGVGLAAIELGKAMGAKVVAAVSSDDKAAAATEAGADATLVYPRGPFDKDGARALAEQFKQAVGSNGADVIYDPVGGDYAEAALRSIAWEGRYLVVGFPAGIPKIPLNLVLLKGCQIVGVFWGGFTVRHPTQYAENIAELIDLYRKGAIRPRISARFPLSRGGEAIAQLASRAAVGKIVVTVGNESDG
jgi:NADPH2:quinone reductase